MNFKDEYINSQMFSWRHHPLRHVAREDELDYSLLYGYVDQLADSLSGLVSTSSFNQFLLESCQLLANSLDLIHQGYFDAAFYSVRQAGEVILIGTLFSNLEESERKAKYEKWVSLDRFPSFSELSKMLRSKDIEYRDLLEQMPEIDELISKLNKRANKYIHKQGHESFYELPPISWTSGNGRFSMSIDLRVKHDLESRRRAVELFDAGVGCKPAAEALSVPR